MHFVPTIGAVDRRPDANVHHPRVSSSLFIDYPDGIDTIARSYLAGIKQLQIGPGKADLATASISLHDNTIAGIIAAQHRCCSYDVAPFDRAAYLGGRYHVTPHHLRRNHVDSEA